jgi:hypothetical protein
LSWLFSEPGYSRTQGNFVHPAGNPGFSPEGRPGLPELKKYLLKKVLPIFRSIPVNPAHLMDNALVLVNDMREFFFQRLYFGQLVVLTELFLTEEDNFFEIRKKPVIPDRP